MMREAGRKDNRYPGIEFIQTSPNSVIGFFENGHHAYYCNRDGAVMDVAMAEIWKAWVKGRAVFASPVTQ